MKSMREKGGLDVMIKVSEAFEKLLRENGGFGAGAQVSCDSNFFAQ